MLYLYVLCTFFYHYIISVIINKKHNFIKATFLINLKAIMS